jgi:outer membrane protein insertion porin family
MKSQRLVILVAAMTSLNARAQETDSVRVRHPTYGIIDTVIITGNEKTRDYVIRDEMTLKPGSVATFDQIEYDRNRIYSLGLFTRVDIDYFKLDSLRLLYVDVRERWYIIPLPIFGFRDGDPKKPYYGAGLLYNNFRGCNQRLYGSVVFGYDPSIDFSFYDPLIDREQNLYFSLGLSSAKVRNRSDIEAALTGPFDERHYDINASLGKRFTLYETAGIDLGYHIVDVSVYRQGRTASSSGRDSYLYGTVNYVYDSRDLKEYATSGHFTDLSITKYGFGDADLDFARYTADIRHYIPLPFNFSLAMRAYGSIVSGGLIPTYARAYLGYSERVRGYFDTVSEGEDLAGATLELRYSLLKARTIIFTALPIPEEFSIWRFGISLALFADAGRTWFRKDVLTLGSFASGYGAGIHFLLPYSYVMRVEYAFNEYFKGQFILDLRTSI